MLQRKEKSCPVVEYCFHAIVIFLKSKFEYVTIVISYVMQTVLSHQKRHDFSVTCLINFGVMFILFFI
jgi:hypothetical protein